MSTISIKRKLVNMQFLSAMVVLIICSVAYIVHDLSAFRNTLVRNLSSSARILALNVTTPLLFLDKEEAAKTLSSIQAEPHLTAAYLFDADGNLFSLSSREPYVNTPTVPYFEGLEWSQIKDDRLFFYYKIFSEVEGVGTLVLVSSVSPLSRQYKQYFLIVFIVTLTGFVLSYSIGMVVQRQLSRPIKALVDVLKTITSSQDYSIRVQSGTEEKSIAELSALSNEFNNMIDQIQLRDQAIMQAKNTLEERVVERTKELSKANRELDESLHELSETQALLVQSSKMSALGEMAGGIAHEINNPLAIIHMLLSQLQSLVVRNPIDTKLISEMLSRALDTTNRISKIVYGLRTFSRDTDTETYENTNVMTIVADTLNLCMERFKNHGIRLRIEGPETVVIPCRPVQISQVLLNILNNADDAIAHLAEKWVEITVVEERDFVEISVTDSGHGISPATQSKLFQPFFSTKGIGRGTGLGLSISKGIIDSHNGSLTYDAGSKNTRFVIRLPKRR